MGSAREEIIQLENRFWQSMVDHHTEVAIAMLDEPAVIVSGHGALQFDRATYRQMAQQDTMAIKAFELSNMNVLFPNENTAVVTYHARQTLTVRGQSAPLEQDMTDSSVWLRKDGCWLCAMHTETPLEKPRH